MKDGAREFYRAAIRRSRWYYIALVSIDAIFAKGIGGVYHGKGEAYYKGLCLLPAERLAKLDLAKMSERECVKALAAAQLDPLMVEDGAEFADGRDEEPEPADSDDRIYAAIISARPMAALVPRDSSRMYAGVDFRIYYDNCSHQSGRQRAWVVCPDTGHSRCFRYRFLDSFPSGAHCEAFLIAWAHPAVDGSLRREEHQRFIPTVDACEVVLAAYDGR